MFESISFNGTFRSYQQKILDEADKYLSDGKINIVAAPGSGKTILGLELIRRLGKPCIILSPTTTIREQWGERFLSGFSGIEDMPSLLSFDLKNPKPITSVTYQALYSAMAKVKCRADGEEVDNSEVDVFDLIEKCGIETVCLDEAHHLQNEWQKALEAFLQKLDGRCKLVSLTATPPYDANTAEWKRYIDVCGEIDEEIFVPELVRVGTLCPHQDYVYFNYPEKSEAEEFQRYTARAAEAMEKLKTHPSVLSASKNLTARTADLNGWLYENFKEVTALLLLFKNFGLKVDEKLDKSLDTKHAPKFDLEQAEIALNFLLSEEKLLFDGEREELKVFFKEYDLLEHGKVALRLNTKLKRKLISSVGKLKSISAIAACERKSLGEKLRLLVLTDYIKKENISAVGTDEKFNSVSVLSVFETLRRTRLFPVGALSGTLVILPAVCAESLKKSGVKFTARTLADGEYAEFIFKGDNRDKVEAVGRLFERGEICALVGTKSLLGEGWDSPCINTLILASFVGSFMLSNQMRGRAIRVDKNDSGKTADIWHLVTVEPPYILGQSAFGTSKDELISADYEVLCKRFECFVAPNYDTDVIESGIDRVTAIHPPYDKRGVERINEDMMQISSRRDLLKERWQGALSGSSGIHSLSEVPSNRKMPAFTFLNVGLSLLLCTVCALILWGVIVCYGVLTKGISIALTVIGCIAIFVIGDILLTFISRRILRHFNPKRSVTTLAKCVVDTLKEFEMLSDACTLKTSANSLGTVIDCELLNASRREQKLFQAAMQDLFSAIENPRYVLIPLGICGVYRYKYALACPDVLGSKQEYAQSFAQKLKRSLGKLKVVYTRGEGGKRLLFKCRACSYITFNDDRVNSLFST